MNIIHQRSDFRKRRASSHAWATTGFNKLLVFGTNFSAVVPEMIALAAFAIVFGLIAIWRFRTAAN